MLKLMCIELVMPPDHLILCHPLLLLPPVPLSIRGEPFNTSYDIYEASRQKMLDETSDIYKMLRNRYDRELRKAA